LNVVRGKLAEPLCDVEEKDAKVLQENKSALLLVSR
jgi:hypothetical protein